jgi:hypothetical protein
MDELGYLDAIYNALVRINDMGDLILAGACAVLIIYLCYTVLHWFSLF